MKVVLILCVAICAVRSQGPVPCDSPKQWEGREFRIDFRMNYFEKRHLYYDEINQRERTLAEVELNSSTTFYDHLYLHQENKNYTINRKQRTCTVSTLDRPFHRRGVHSDARFEQVVTLGNSALLGQGLKLQIFSANETNEFYTGLVTMPDCVPVENIHISKEYGYEHSEYFDITVGISEPEAFIPPPECNGL